VVHLVRGAAEVNAKSVVAILGFEVKEGDALQIKATGQDALKAAETLAKLLDEGCGDSPGQAPAAAPSVPSAPRGNPRGENELAGLESPLLRERANDIRDVGRRALALLTGSVQTRMEAPADSILIADELSPSEAAQLDRTRVLGLCTTTGGPTGHVAILARALGIPAVCGIDPAALELPDQTLVLLDGGTGILRRIPTEAGQAEARELVGRQAAQRAEESAAAQKPAVTRDGVAIEVAANIRNAQEAREAVAAGAQGVGLLRSEFLFLDRETAPTEDEQAAEYGAVARILGLGVDELSVSVPAIGAIKALISRLDRAQCQTLAHELLQMRTAAEVRERLAVVAE